MLITELADQVTKGETPDLETVCRQYPHFESDLRQLWGTLIVTQAAATEQSADQFATMPMINEGLELPCDFGNYTLESEPCFLCILLYLCTLQFFGSIRTEIHFWQINFFGEQNLFYL